MIDQSRYTRLIFNHFSKRETFSQDDIVHFGEVVRQRLAQIQPTGPGQDPEAELAAFESEFTLFRDAPMEYLEKLRVPSSTAPHVTAETVPDSASALATLAPPPMPAPVARTGVMAYVVGAAAMAGVLSLGYLLLSGSCGMPLSGCADSGWLPANSNSSTTLTFTHGLGPTPRQVSLFYKHRLEDDMSYPVIRSWSPDDNGNPVTVALTSTDVVLHIVGGPPLHGTWSAAASWRKQKQGFFRIVVIR